MLRHFRAVLLMLLVMLAETIYGERIAGRIIDSATLETIAGVNIVVIGTEIGTATDDDGYFRITADLPYPWIIQIDHIAYAQQNIRVSDESPLLIQLNSKPVELQGVVVNEERRRTEIEITTSADIIDAQQISSLAYRDVGEIIRSVPSVNLIPTGSGKQYASIRGSNANEVRVLLDGIPLNSANGGFADLSQINLLSLESVTVLKSAGTVLHGAGIFGGVISVNSDVPEKPSFNIMRSFGISDENDGDQNIGIAGVIRNFRGNISLQGKTRVYTGEALQRQFIHSAGTDIDVSGGELSGRYHNISNFLELPDNQGTLQGEDSKLVSLKYVGDLYNSPKWDLLVGRRTWNCKLTPKIWTVY